MDPQVLLPRNNGDANPTAYTGGVETSGVREWQTLKPERSFDAIVKARMSLSLVGLAVRISASVSAWAQSCLNRGMRRQIPGKRRYPVAPRERETSLARENRAPRPWPAEHFSDS